MTPLLLSAVLFAWDPVPNVDGYRIFIGSSPGHYTAAIDCPTPEASIDFSGVRYLAVVSVRRGIQSDFSNEVRYDSDLPYLSVSKEGLSWPGTFPGYSVQRSFTLDGIWRTVGVGTLNADGRYRWTNNMVLPKGFFRLKSEKRI